MSNANIESLHSGMSLKPGLVVRSKANETFVTVETLIWPLQISYLVDIVVAQYY